MTRFRVWFCVAVVALGCGLGLGDRLDCVEQTLAAERAKSTAAEPKYLGHPVRFWVGQAKASQPTVPREKIVEALTLAMEDPKPETRVEAADALGRLGAAAAPAAKALAAQASHPKAWVRAAAAETLVGLGKAAVPSLVEVFRKGDPAVRLRVVVVLGSIGPEASEAVPVLEETLKDEQLDSELRSRITDILPHIRSTANVGNVSNVPGTVESYPTVAAAAPRKPASGTGKPAAASSTSPSTTGNVADWPRFHGPNMDSICPETGLLTAWPKEGPPLAWKLEGLGKGFSTVSIAGGRFFTMGDLKLEGKEEAQYVMAFDLPSRKRLWATRVGPTNNDGPRSTPTVDGELAYCLGTEGDLLCLEVATGAVRWQKNFARDFGGKMMSGWKYSESPLIDGDRLLCTPGGKEAMIVALDKRTGRTIWRSAMPSIGKKGKDGAGYSSMIVAEIAGVRQYVQTVGRGVIGVEAQSGKFLWGYNKIANTVANIPSPLARGNYVFCTTSYKTGSALLEIRRKGDAFEAKEVYFLGPNEFENHHGGVVLVDGYIYGGSGQNAGEPVCFELASGKIAWSAKPPDRGSAAVLYADGHIYFRFDRGTVALVEATSKGFHVKSSFKPLVADGPAWAHPVIHDGKLYLRHNDLLACYDLRKK